MEILKTIVNEKNEIWLEDNIIHLIINQPVIDLPLLEALQKVRTELCQGQICLDFHDMRMVKYATRSAREYFANPENCQWVKAGAVLIKFKVAETIANYYLKFQTPPVPTRFFYCRQEAMAWLSTHQ